MKAKMTKVFSTESIPALKTSLNFIPGEPEPQGAVTVAALAASVSLGFVRYVNVMAIPTASGGVVTLSCPATGDVLRLNLPWSAFGFLVYGVELEFEEANVWLLESSSASGEVMYAS